MRARVGTAVVVVACVAVCVASFASGAAIRTGVSVTGPSAAKLVHGDWSVLARSPLGGRVNATVVWTGRELIEAGGESPGRFQDGVGGGARTGAAAFDPQTGTWRRIAVLPSRSLAVNALSVWTGTRLFLLSQPQPPAAISPARAAVYDPATDSWESTAPAPIAAPAVAAAAVWSAGRVLVATIAGDFVHGTRLATAAFHPAEREWSAIPLTLPRGHGAAAVAMVATHRGVVLWSLWSRSREYSRGNFTIYSGVDVFRLVGQRWIRQRVGWAQHRTVDQPLFTGSRILLGANQIWCGTCSHPAPLDANGWTVDPATLRVSKLPHGPLDDLQPQILWSGAAEIAVNAGGEIVGPNVRVLPGDIAFLDLRAMRWYRGPRAPAKIAFGMPAVWDGSQLLALAADGRVLSYHR
jgi:hypothetical protein